MSHVIDSALNEMVAAILQHFAPAKILLFGSRARGDHRVDSDYDLMVVIDEVRPAEDVQRAIRNLVSRQGRPVDVVVTSTSAFERRRTDVGTLQSVVDREGQVLYLDTGSGGTGENGASAGQRRVREPPALPESYAEWLDRAETDYLLMRRSAGDERVRDGTANHAQQCAEKHLKAALVLRGTAPPRTHVLTELLALSDPTLRGDSGMGAACTMLDALWPKLRYPGAPKPTMEETARAIRAARLVRALCRRGAGPSP